MTAREEYAANWEQPTQGLLFPPELLAKAKRVKGCRHPKHYQREGPRVSAVWGSLPTMVCTHCWEWKVKDTHQWHKTPIWERLARDAEHDDEY